MSDTSQELRDTLERNLISWERNQGITLDTEQKQSLIFGVVPAFVDIFEIYATKRVIEELRAIDMVRNQAWYDKIGKRIAELESSVIDGEKK